MRSPSRWPPAGRARGCRTRSRCPLREERSCPQPNAVAGETGMLTRFPEREQPSEVLPGVGHGVDRPTRLGPGLAGDQGPDVDDALALLTGDPGPVVRVGGVRQVLVLAELVDARGQQVTDSHALLAGVEEFLDGHLLGPG